MAKNYMEEVAKMLGVELGEEFRIKDYVNTFHFTNDGLFNNFGEIRHIVLSDLLTGKAEITKLPWKPQKGDKYWTYKGSDFYCSKDIWVDIATDFTRLKCGLVFRTGEEAEAARPAKYKELTGHDWSEKE